MTDEKKGLDVTEQDREFTKDFGKRGSFTLRIPLPQENVDIINMTSRILNGAPLNSIQASDYEYARMLVTLNYVIQSHPNWWSSADECPDEDFLVSKLWRFYLDSEKKFKDMLKKNS